MKYTLALAVILSASWLVWSGILTPFILILGGLSCLVTVFISLRMRVVDEEGAPLMMGVRTAFLFIPWLLLEIVKSNVAVTRTILSRDMNLKRNMVAVPIGPKSELGKVLLANSITLTPGTVSVRTGDDEIMVHALSFEGAAEDISGEMNRRICNMESGGKR